MLCGVMLCIMWLCLCVRACVCVCVFILCTPFLPWFNPLLGHLPPSPCASPAIALVPDSLASSGVSQYGHPSTYTHTCYPRPAHADMHLRHFLFASTYYVKPLGSREVEYCPLHFACVSLPLSERQGLSMQPFRNGMGARMHSRSTCAVRCKRNWSHSNALESRSATAWYWSRHTSVLLCVRLQFECFGLWFLPFLFVLRHLAACVWHAWTPNQVGISTFTGLLKTNAPIHISASYFLGGLVGFWLCWLAAMVQFALFLCDRLARPLVPSVLAGAISTRVLVGQSLEMCWINLSIDAKPYFYSNQQDSSGTGIQRHTTIEYYYWINSQMWY